jgi:hypothetical protein
LYTGSDRAACGLRDLRQTELVSVALDLSAPKALPQYLGDCNFSRSESPLVYVIQSMTLSWENWKKLVLAPFLDITGGRATDRGGMQKNCAVLLLDVSVDNHKKERFVFDRVCVYRNDLLHMATAANAEFLPLLRAHAHEDHFLTCALSRWNREIADFMAAHAKAIHAKNALDPKDVSSDPVYTMDSVLSTATSKWQMWPRERSKHALRAVLWCAATNDPGTVKAIETPLWRCLTVLMHHGSLNGIDTLEGLDIAKKTCKETLSSFELRGLEISASTL